MKTLFKEGSVSGILAIALVGWLRFIPGSGWFIGRLTRNAGQGVATGSARYCYSVWLRHLVMASRNGLPVLPDVVAELGPGYSIGVGLAALISGSSRYYGLDVVEYASSGRNIEVFDELVDLFTRRENIPDEKEFPLLQPRLESHEFPADILTEERLKQALAGDRIASLKEKLFRIGRGGDNTIRYIVPWDDDKVIIGESVDMIFSQSVLEHVENLGTAYRAQYRWLRPHGFVSHSIDFKSHGLARRWNGHWQYSRLAWTILRGNRPYLINRQPRSTHKKLLTKSGFKIIGEIKTVDTNEIPRDRFASPWRDLARDDLTCSGVFIQAVKD
jgi:SAM-dependent methyltransferase